MSDVPPPTQALPGADRLLRLCLFITLIGLSLFGYLLFFSPAPSVKELHQIGEAGLRAQETAKIGISSLFSALALFAFGALASIATAIVLVASRRRYPASARPGPALRIFAPLAVAGISALILSPLAIARVSVYFIQRQRAEDRRTAPDRAAQAQNKEFERQQKFNHDQLHPLPYVPNLRSADAQKRRSALGYLASCANTFPDVLDALPAAERNSIRDTLTSQRAALLGQYSDFNDYAVLLGYFDKQAATALRGEFEQFPERFFSPKSDALSFIASRAIEKNNLDLLARLLECHALDPLAPKNDSPFCLAVRKRDIPALRIMLEHGVPADSPFYDSTALRSFLFTRGPTRSASFACLLEFHADPNQKEGGTPPLCSLVEQNDVESVRIFIQHKANPHLLDRYGHSSFDIAATLPSPDCDEMLAILKQYDASAKPALSDARAHP